MTTYTKCQSIFNVLKDYFIEKAIPSSKILLSVIDGAAAMFGYYLGFLDHLKENLLQIVIKAVNPIRSIALNTRFIPQLCEENYGNFHEFLNHTEVN